MRGAAGATGAAARPAADRLADACQVLGVRPEASDADVTLAYRRLMSQNHPDKLVANGLPQSMIEAGTSVEAAGSPQSMVSAGAVQSGYSPQS